jgi:hypothetical protein
MAESPALSRIPGDSLSFSFGHQCQEGAYDSSTVTLSEGPGDGELPRLHKLHATLAAVRLDELMRLGDPVQECGFADIGIVPPGRSNAGAVHRTRNSTHKH